ncbi:hypothetical protein BN3660_03010 [Eubacteriaceae bacterium CHKCI004]|nr:hypothetical protein BN3660_03010 [Eubacteriaceae bacterium CHKCI004]
MKKIYTAATEAEGNELVRVLREQGIPSYTKEGGSGEYMRIAWGTSIYGTGLYVKEEDTEMASVLIKEYRQENWNADDHSELIKEESSATIVPWYKNKVFVARGILAWMAIMMVMLFIFEYMSQGS